MEIWYEILSDSPCSAIIQPKSLLSDACKGLWLEKSSKKNGHNIVYCWYSMNRWVSPGWVKGHNVRLTNGKRGLGSHFRLDRYAMRMNHSEDETALEFSMIFKDNLKVDSAITYLSATTSSFHSFYSMKRYGVRGLRSCCDKYFQGNIKSRVFDKIVTCSTKGNSSTCLKWLWWLTESIRLRQFAQIYISYTKFIFLSNLVFC